MAISLGKKKTPAPEADQETKAEAPTKQAEPTSKKDAPAKGEDKPKGFVSALKRGKAAAEALAAEDHRAEQNSKNQNLRFFMKDGDEASITFLDGDLDADGMLDIPFYFEHNVTIGGKYGNFFVCTSETEPCPICEGGIQASYVGLLTIIDHRSYESKKDSKTYKDQVRLFAAKRGTIKMLQKIAEKRGGLAGARFDVSRTGAQSAAVGSMFDYTDKMTKAQILAKYGEKAVPLDYDTIVGEISLPASELRKLGFGSLKGPMGSESGADGGTGDDYADKM